METLPKDIVRLLMLSYFDEFDAVACLAAAKRFVASLLPGEDRLLRVRVLVARARKEQWEMLFSCITPSRGEGWTLCPLCLTAVLPTNKYHALKCPQRKERQCKKCSECGMYDLTKLPKSFNKKERFYLGDWHDAYGRGCPLHFSSRWSNGITQENYLKEDYMIAHRTWWNCY